MSAYLFIIAIEILANKIRYDKDIKGIIISNKDIKISLLAHDVTCFVKEYKKYEKKS